jgi:dTDP-L-rhamnose 4-epimerase
MRVLVTGGAGFIGSHIVDQLVELGHEVVVVDSLAEDVHPGPPADLNPAARWLEADLNDIDGWLGHVGPLDAVCHQASRVGLGVDFGDVRRYAADNDAGTAALLWGLHEQGFAGRFVLASSMVVYGEGRYRCQQHGVVRPGPRSAHDLDAGRFEPPCPICGAAVSWALVPEDAPLEPRNVYAATKLHQEHLCTVFGHEHEVPVAALRYHNVYGSRMPRDTPYAGVASIFRSAVARGHAPRVFEDGGQQRDFVHVDDVARANVLALTREEPAEGAFNVASGVPHTVLDLAVALCAGTDLQPQVVGGGRAGDVRHVVASPERAGEVLGFRAQVSFDAGMRAFSTARLRGGGRSPGPEEEPTGG